VREDLAERSSLAHLGPRRTSWLLAAQINPLAAAGGNASSRMICRTCRRAAAELGALPATNRGRVIATDAMSSRASLLFLLCRSNLNHR
jgi:hypothetical protein